MPKTKALLKKLKVKKSKTKPKQIKRKKTKAKKGYANRYEVTSERSGNVYVVSRTEKNGIWRCNCLGYMRHRMCRHVISVLSNE